MSLGGVVLAGGAGRRLTGQGKAAVEVGGVPLAVRAVTALRRAGSADVVVVTRPGVPLPPLGARVVEDDPGPPGPLNAVRTGLSRSATVEVLVVACDLPFAAPLLTRVAGGPAGRAVVAVDTDGRRQPLCGRYPRVAALAAAEAALAAGEQRMAAWLDRLAAAVGLDEEQAHGEELMNVNERHDLARADGTGAR